MKCERHALASEAVVALSIETFPADGPERIGEMLLDQRNLRLHRQLDIAQAGLWAAIGRDASEDPRAPLLEHQAARAVNRVHQDAHLSLIRADTLRQRQ